MEHPNLGIFVAKDVWVRHRPVLWLRYEHNDDPDDSGWTAGSDMDSDEWVIVSLEELVQRDPTVEVVLRGGLGKAVCRSGVSESWRSMNP